MSINRAFHLSEKGKALRVNNTDTMISIKPQPGKRQRMFAGCTIQSKRKAAAGAGTPADPGDAGFTKISR